MTNSIRNLFRISTKLVSEIILIKFANMIILTNKINEGSIHFFSRNFFSTTLTRDFNKIYQILNLRMKTKYCTVLNYKIGLKFHAIS